MVHVRFDSPAPAACPHGAACVADLLPTALRRVRAAWFGAAALFLPSTASADPVKEAIDVIVLFCAAGGEQNRFALDGRVDGGFTLRRAGVAGGGSINITKAQAKGLVDGLQAQMNSVAGEQAAEARKCMKPHIDRILDVLLPRKPAAGEQVMAVPQIGGVWRDVEYPGNRSRITQRGSTFQFSRWGTLADGTPFTSTGSGTLAAQSLASSYRATYQSGATSTGDCSGMVSPDGGRISLTCTDSLLRAISVSSIRQ
jgi:hypothetical protein